MPKRRQFWNREGRPGRHLSLLVSNAGPAPGPRTPGGRAPAIAAAVTPLGRERRPGSRRLPPPGQPSLSRGLGAGGGGADRREAAGAAQPHAFPLSSVSVGNRPRRQASHRCGGGVGRGRGRSPAVPAPGPRPRDPPRAARTGSCARVRGGQVRRRDKRRTRGRNHGSRGFEPRSGPTH